MPFQTKQGYYYMCECGFESLRARYENGEILFRCVSCGQDYSVISFRSARTVKPEDAAKLGGGVGAEPWA